MEKSELLQRAKLAEKTGRYEECANYMSKLVHEQGKLEDDEEQKLLTVSYKKMVAAHRATMKTLDSLVEEKSMDPRITMIYRKEVEREMYKTCREFLSMLDEFLINEDCDERRWETLVDYMTMKGDFLTFCMNNIERAQTDGMIEHIGEVYRRAMNYSRGLPRTNPTRLAVCLSTSVFEHDHGDNKIGACNLAHEAYEGAIGEMQDRDLRNEDLDPESKELMEQIRDNLNLWKRATHDEDL